MPLNKTRKVRERKRKILEILEHADYLSLLKKTEASIFRYTYLGLSTSEIADMLDCSISQAYYALKELEREGLVEKEESRGGKPGRRFVWKIK